MSSFSYGTPSAAAAERPDDPQMTELRHRGYCVLPDVLDSAQLSLARKKLDDVYALQERETGREALSAIKDLDLARLPLAYDPWFLELAAQPAVLRFVRQALGEYVILHLQNGIINRPAQRHHQAAWHRDLPYQEWTSSRPLALSALFCLEPFTVETGGTFVLPHSHRWEKLPPAEFVEKHAIPALAPAGSVIVFDCMLFHRAGENRSSTVRRGVNHVYAIPLLKQQIDIPRALGDDAVLSPELRQLLGYTSQPAASVTAWRSARLARAVKS